MKKVSNVLIFLPLFAVYAIQPDAVVGRAPKVDVGVPNVYSVQGSTVQIPVFLLNNEDAGILKCAFSVHVYEHQAAQLAPADVNTGFASHWNLRRESPTKSSSPDTDRYAFESSGKSINRGAFEVLKLNVNIAADFLAHSPLCSLEIREIEIQTSIGLIKPASKKVYIRLDAKPIQVPGDVTGDGYVRSDDASHVLNCIVKSVSDYNICDAFAGKIADVNGDARVTSLDAVALLQHSVGIIPTLPVTGFNQPVQLISNPRVAIDGPQKIAGSVYTYQIYLLNGEGAHAVNLYLSVGTTLAAEIKDVRTEIPDGMVVSDHDALLHRYTFAWISNFAIRSSKVLLATLIVRHESNAHRAVALEKGYVNDALIKAQGSQANTAIGLQKASRYAASAIRVNGEGITVQRSQLPYSVSVINVMGSSILAARSKVPFFPLSALPAGVFLIRVTTPDFDFVDKVNNR
ncbi:MAG: hypothetical protein GF398_07125 [Chitinivibrionales bacterium]|nr:hypothetical protein [Chitinivibrionales bacterium]